MAELFSSLVLYCPDPANSTSLNRSSTSLISSRLFSQQTGTAIATELLYRILYDIINRFLGAFQRLASKSMEECSTWLGRKMKERSERLATVNDSAAEGLHIAEEVGKLAAGRGFVTCPLTGPRIDVTTCRKSAPPGPRIWVRDVLEGIDTGRMHARDFWIHTHGD